MFGTVFKTFYNFWRFLSPLPPHSVTHICFLRHSSVVATKGCWTSLTENIVQSHAGPTNLQDKQALHIFTLQMTLDNEDEDGVVLAEAEKWRQRQRLRQT